MNKMRVKSLLLALLLPFTIAAQNLSQNEKEKILNRYEYTPYHWNKSNLSYYIYNTSSHMTATARKNAIESALYLWEIYTSFTFEETTNISDADILFAWVTGEHGDGMINAFGPDSATTAHMYPETSGNLMNKANIHFNDYKNWVDKEVPDSGEIDLVHTTLHEVGHALGLDHSEVNESIMRQGLSQGRILCYDELRGIWNKYGCPFTIEGPSSVCTDAIYSTLLPSRMHINYSVAGAITEGMGYVLNGVRVIKNQNGVGNISATLRDWYYYEIRTISTGDIAVGTPDLGMSIQPQTATGVNGCWASNMIGNTFTLENDLSWAYDRVEAQLYRLDNNFNPSTLVNSWSNISTTNASIPGYTAGWYLFKLRGVNDCGYSDWLEQEVEMVDFSMLSFLLDYDAASETLTLTLIEPDSQNAQGAEASSQSITRGTYEIQLWNGIFSTMARSYKTDLTKYQMSLAGLPRGVYIVRVVLDGKTYSKKFVKR